MLKGASSVAFKGEKQEREKGIQQKSWCTNIIARIAISKSATSLSKGNLLSLRQDREEISVLRASPGRLLLVSTLRWYEALGNCTAPTAISRYSFESPVLASSASLRERGASTALHLVSAKATSTGVLVATYEPDKSMARTGP